MNPPYARDLLSPHDNNYVTAPVEAGSDGLDDSGDVVDDDTFKSAPTLSNSDPTTNSTMSPVAQGGGRHLRTLRRDPLPPPACAPSAARKTAVPYGMTPQLLSSIDTSDFSPRRRPANTGVRRQNNSTQSELVEAMRTTGAAMTSHLKEIAEVGRSRMDLQLRLFTDQMDYQKERDLRLYENAILVNETAKLAVQKQSQVVSCLVHMSKVLTAGFAGRMPTYAEVLRRRNGVLWKQQLLTLLPC